MSNPFTHDWLQKKTTLENHLTGLLSFLQSTSVLYAPIEHSIFAGGKRLRAILLLDTFEALSRQPLRAALDAACALEVLHCFSLVHDDLPCMDNDEYRRGKKTTHTLYGEDIGLLTGDALFAIAFQILSSIPENVLPPSATLHLIRILCEKGGIQGMIEGQALECYQESAFEIDQKTFFSIIHRKTSALFSAAFMMGSVCALQPPQIIASFEKIGFHFGNAFQLADDFHDQDNPTEKTNAFQLFDPDSMIQFFSSELDQAEALLLEAVPHTAQTFLEIFQWLRNQIA
ncbi:MAG: polyprenyl synthetase family protein [Caldisericia bacterium]|nr:polyprenyl synthetase family protein [Caldisericia bacterium]MDD4614286.1 polyprenyl synthetase family protein [Caldisericia bacterium]